MTTTCFLNKYSVYPKDYDCSTITMFAFTIGWRWGSYEISQYTVVWFHL